MEPRITPRTAPPASPSRSSRHWSFPVARAPREFPQGLSRPVASASRRRGDRPMGPVVGGGFESGPPRPGQLPCRGSPQLLSRLGNPELGLDRSERRRPWLVRRCDARSGRGIPHASGRHDRTRNTRWSRGRQSRSPLRPDARAGPRPRTRARRRARCHGRIARGRCPPRSGGDGEDARGVAGIGSLVGVAAADAGTIGQATLSTVAEPRNEEGPP